MKMPMIKRCAVTCLCVILTLATSLFTAIDSKADDTATVEKQLLSFADCKMGKNFELPDRMSFISKYSTYDGTQTVEESDGKKFLNIALNKSVKKQTSDLISGRNSRIAFKVTVPSQYLDYLDEITLNYSNDVKQSNSQTKMYAVVGVTDGKNYGKTVNKSLSFTSGTDKEIKVKLSDMLSMNESGFLGNCGSNVKKWSDAGNGNITEILVYITMPYCTGREKYNVGIKGLSVTLTGDAETLKNIDKINPLIEDFEALNTLDELKQKNTFGLNGNFELVNDSGANSNALLYKGKISDGTDYNSAFDVKFDKRVSEVKGITFTVRNLEPETEFTMRCFLYTKDSAGKTKTYQYITTAVKDSGKFVKVRIYFDNVGEKTGDEFWGGSSAGTAMTAGEIRNLTSLRIRIPYLYTSHAGVEFDNFEYIVEDDRLIREKTLVDFDNCVAGGEIPEGVKLGGSYKGTNKIVEKADGTKALRMYYDASAGGTTDKINERSNIAVKITVPKGTLHNAEQIRVNVTNNAINCDNTFSSATNIYYLTVINDGKNYGRYYMSHKAPNVGEEFVNKIPTNSLYKTSDGWLILNWFNTDNSPKWTADELDGVESITVYVTAPACEGTEGWSFDLNSVSVYYSELPEYNEDATRYVVRADEPEKLSSESVAAEVKELSSNNPNFRKFTKSVSIETKKADNTVPVVFVNRCYNYLRKLDPFTDTATLFMYARSNKATTLKMSMVTKSGGRLPFEVKLEASAENEFSEVTLKIADILNAYTAENPDSVISLDDVYCLEILPTANEPSTVEIACLSIWTKDVGNVSDSKTYYFYDNGVAVEAYNENLNNTDVTKIEGGDPASMVAEWGIKVPKGLTPLLFKTVSLYDKSGNVTLPKNNVWITFDLPEGTDLNNISFYKVFFDGSLLQSRYVLEGDKLSLSTYMVGSYMIFSGKLTENTVTDNTDSKSDSNSTVSDSDMSYDNTDDDYYDDYGDDDEDYTEDDEGTEDTIIRRKKMMRKKKTNASDDTNYTAWIIAAAGALVVLGGGVTLAVILIKRKKGAAK